MFLYRKNQQKQFKQRATSSFHSHNKFYFMYSWTSFYLETTFAFIDLYLKHSVVSSTCCVKFGRDTVRKWSVTGVKHGSLNSNYYVKSICLPSVYHRGQHDELLQRGGTCVLLQDQSPPTGRKQTVPPPAAARLVLLPESTREYLHLTPPTTTMGTNRIGLFYYYVQQLVFCSLKIWNQ